MIVAHGLADDGHLTVLIGLTKDNCRLLLEGKPIRKGPETTRVPMTIIIVGGETEEKIQQELQEAGLLDRAIVFDDKAEYERQKGLKT